MYSIISDRDYIIYQLQTNMQKFAQKFQSIEKKVKLVSTSTSGFANIVEATTIENSNNRNFNSIQNKCKFQEQHSSLADRNSHIKLMTQTKQIANQLQKLKQLNKNTLECLTSQQLPQQFTAAYTQISQHNLQTETHLKLKINETISKTDQQIQQIFKNRITNQKKYEKQIINNLQQLNQLKDKYKTQYTKLKNIKYDKINRQMTILKKEISAYMEQNLQFKNQIFGKLQSVRYNLNKQITQQQNKRKSFNEIMEKLLDKSCKKAQEMLRRKL